VLSRQRHSPVRPLHVDRTDLRHSFGSQLAAAGVPLRQVQEWLGHSTITMTMRYMHLAPGGGRELIGVLDSCRANGVQNGIGKIGK
jgi:site-specific recombinase XerD